MYIESLFMKRMIRQCLQPVFALCLFTLMPGMIDNYTEIVIADEDYAETGQGAYVETEFVWNKSSDTVIVSLVQSEGELQSENRYLLYGDGRTEIVKDYPSITETGYLDKPVIRNLLAEIFQAGFFDMDGGKIKDEVQKTLKESGSLFAVMDAPFTRISVDTLEISNQVGFYALRDYAEAFPQVKSITRLAKVADLITNALKGKEFNLQ